MGMSIRVTISAAPARKLVAIAETNGPLRIPAGSSSLEGERASHTTKPARPIAAPIRHGIPHGGSGLFCGSVVYRPAITAARETARIDPPTRSRDRRAVD